MIIIQLATFSSQPVNFQGFFVISNVAQVRNTSIKYIHTYIYTFMHTFYGYLWQVDNVSAGVSESASLFAAKASLTAVRTQNALSDAEAVGSASAGDYLHVQYEGTFKCMKNCGHSRIHSYIYIHTYIQCPGLAVRLRV